MTKKCHGLHMESSLRAKIKIICSEFILSSLITASPMALSGGDIAWREAAEEPHLPALTAQPQECFSSGPLSPMWRRPLHRVCFACKAGCRCCPRKSDQEGQGGGPGHKEAPLPCHPPGLASLFCHPLRSSQPNNTSHYFTPLMPP